MTFEEFFKKKKINVLALEQAEPGLFSEFRLHFDQMGEKSFDHTKKYWFNKLRLKFPAPVEEKVEKLVIENKLAEQTITESLIESSSPSPTVGFKPKFRPGLTKPAEPAPVEKAEEPQAEKSAPTPAVGFKPRFKAGVTKPAESVAEEKVEEPKTEQPAPTPAVGFKPRFKAGVTKPAETASAEKKGDTQPEQPAPTPAVGFKPRFKAGITKPASEESKEEPKTGSGE